MNPIWDYVKKVEPHLPAGQRMQVAGALYSRLKAKKEALEKSLGRKANDGEITYMLREEGEPQDVASRIVGNPREPELVTRYLASIQRRLPPAILSAIEAKEDTLGRAANTDEVGQVLKEFGHPVVVAARYGGGDYVIGPKYYPWFWYVQRIAVGAALAIAFGVSAIRALGSEEPMRAVMRGLSGALEAGVWAFGVVTILFVLAERFKFDMGWAEKWNPKDLPRDQVRQPKGLLESGLTVAFDVVFLLWWVKIVQFPNQLPMREGASAAITFSPVWAAVYWPVLVLAVAILLVHLMDLVRPAWTPLRSVLSIAGHAAGLGVLWVLYQGQPLALVTAVSGADAVEIERVTRVVDNVISISLGVAALIWAVTIGVEVWRLWKSARPVGRVVA
jgi:hypothetical protein